MPYEKAYKQWLRDVFDPLIDAVYEVYSDPKSREWNAAFDAHWAAEYPKFLARWNNGKLRLITTTL